MSRGQLDIVCSSYRDNCKLFVVGIGASAGGLQALEKFFKNMPTDSGAAFVVVQHLSPNFKSLMKELLERHTRMEIHRATDGIELAANSVYLIPKDKNIIIEGSKLRLVKRESRKHLKPNFPINLFFNSLAKTCQEKAIGIILSGSGSDGSLGLKEIHEAGGLVLVQEPLTAEFDGMPLSAIAKLNLHNVLQNFSEDIPQRRIQQVDSPEQLARLTYRFLVSPASVQQEYINSNACLQNVQLEKITDILFKYNQVNFSSYKYSALSRRIHNRCSANSKNLDEYIKYLQESDEEKQALFKHLLIAATSFFKDKDAWEFLQNEVIPNLIEKSQPDEELKFWVSGCATGEEAYSLAILIDEALSKLSLKLQVKIFATDVNSNALGKAILGIYPLTIANDISPERLEKYFLRQQDSFKVKRKLQKMLIFAHHDLEQDAVFTRINLIVYRNILMSMQPDLQHKTLLNLHFSLKNKGILFLGNA
ncbi:MAG: chemotaxis protein CheB, partial [Cyanobacteriota bacterium]|nr:chemotaxis protein CheB [Cyanobacteriota bacterium]